MKVLVTGCRGQLVQSLIERSQSYKVELIAIGRPDLDLENPGSIRKTLSRLRPDVVISSAAYTAVDLAEDEPGRAFRVNGRAAGELAEVSRSVGARIIQISTDYVFDGTSPVPYDETAVPNPIGVYGLSKLEGESRVRAANPDHVILRTAWVYSPFARNFVKTMMTLAQTRQGVNVVADQRGSPTSALEFADGIFSILSRWSAGGREGLGEVFHLAGTGSATWFEFARHVFAECARLGYPSAIAHPVTTAAWPTRARRPANSMLDCAKFAATYGFTMSPWQASVAATVCTLGKVKSDVA